MSQQPARVQVRRAAIPIFRKIFRKRGRFVCGICRSSYQNRSDANNCLNFCWFELQEHYPLIRRRDAKSGVYVFRCQYCARDYKSEFAGLECARLCVEQRNQRHIHEQLINELPLEIKRKHPVRLVHANKPEMRPLAIRTVFGQKAKNSEPSLQSETTAIDHSIDHAQPESIDNSETETNPEATLKPSPVSSDQPETEGSDDKRDDKLRRRKDSFPKSFIRKDAKYQCCCCLKKYFTKMEVEQCFEGHFDSEGYEIIED